jgi:hypothetical protein
MDTDNLLIICRTCGRKTLMHNMVPAEDGENMICVDCHKKTSSGRPVESVLGKKHVDNEPFHARAEKKGETKSEKIIKYICQGCAYKFSRKGSQHVEKCPYCGKTNILVDSQLGADNLIKDSMSKKFDW